MRAATAIAGVSLALLPGLAAADAERGAALAERWCTPCHVIAPDAPGGDAGPAFATLRLERSEPGLRAWLFQPHPPMPDLNLAADEIEALLAYIRTLPGAPAENAAGNAEAAPETETETEGRTE